MTSSVHVTCYLFLTEGGNKISTVKMLWSSICLCKRWAGHVARMGEETGCIGSCWGNRREGDHWGDLGIDGWIILGWISRRWDLSIWTGLADPG